MSTLPDAVHERLSSEFQFAASKIVESNDQATKLYYFSVFHGETSRQLNMHWDADLALLFVVAQAFTAQVPARPALPVLGTPAGTLVAEFLPVIDQISLEIAAAFQTPDIDGPRLHAALAKTAELIYATTGNGTYLYLKGEIKF